MTLLGIMIGGALGSLVRYATGLWMSGLTAGQPGVGLPLATLLVNVVGSFLLSVLVTLGLRDVVPQPLRLALGTGFIGALTTFSTFQLESDMLLRQGNSALLTLYVLGNLVLGYLGVLLGRSLVMRIAGA